MGVLGGLGGRLAEPLSGNPFVECGLCDALCAPLQADWIKNKPSVVESPEFVRVSGTSDDPVKSAIFFTVPYPVGTPGNIGLLAEIKHQGNWKPDLAYPLLPSAGIQFGKLNIYDVAAISDPTLWYSSCDFVELLAFEGELLFRGQQDRPMATLIAGLEQATGLKDLRRFRAGINFRGMSDAGKLLAPLRECLAGTDLAGAVPSNVNLPGLFGAVGLTPQGLFLEVGAKVDFSLPLLKDRLTVGLNRVWLRGDRLVLDTPQMSMGLVGEINAGGNQMDVALSLTPGAGAIVVEAIAGRKPGAKKDEKDWIATLLASADGKDPLGGLGNDLKGVLGSFDRYIPTVKRLNASVPLSKNGSPHLAVLLGYHEPFKFGEIEVDPSLSVVTDLTGKGTTVTLSGRCLFGNAVMLDVIINPGQKRLIASMATGSAVDVARFLKAVEIKLPGGNHTLTVVNVDLDVTLDTKTLFFHVLSIGHLEFTVGTTPLRIGELELRIEKDTDVRARLAGVFGIGDHLLGIEAEYEDKCFSFRCVVPRISIAGLGRDLFGADVDLPAGLKTAEVTDLRLGLTVGDRTEFQFSARSNATIPIGGLGIGLRGLDVDYVGETKTLSIWGGACLDIDIDSNLSIDLELGYRSDQGGKCWFLKTGAARPIPLQPLLSKIAEAFDAKGKFDFLSGEVTVTPTVYVELGTTATRIVFLCKAGGGAAEASLLITVRKRHKGEKGHEETSGWEVLVSAMAPRLDLSGLPLIGPVVQAAGGLVLDDTRVGYASTTIEADSALLSAPRVTGFTLPTMATPLPEGVSFGTTLRLGKPDALLFERRLAYPDQKRKEEPRPQTKEPEQRSPAPSNPPTSAAPTTSQQGEAKKTEKTAPIQIQQVRYEWKDSRIGILIDGGIELAGFKFGLIGLAVRVPPAVLLSVPTSLDPKAVQSYATKVGKQLEFGLEGLALDVKRGPLSITGALLKTAEGEKTAYSGMAAIRTASFGVSAYGSYTDVGGKPSVLIFGSYLGLIGGPPAFMVTGIAAGFGYNRALTMPPIEKVADFPLVRMAMGSGGVDSLTKPETFPPAEGRYWVAAGVRFTSFKLIDAAVLATVQFGTRFEVALLGMATFQQPQGCPVVQAELALSARLVPEDGILSVQAQLTDKSFLFHESCRLTGGFAFRVWFKPSANAGDFVITLGGYHPKFKPPPHYPQVPRVGLRWALPDAGVTIEGSVYFALTPSMVMAGGKLSAIYKSEVVHAWFVAYADFLAAWEPFRYEAEIDVRVGCRVTLRTLGCVSTLAFDVGARLRIDGPPFAGEALVDVGVMTFTVPIGEKDGPRIPDRLTWPQFAEKFIPVEKDEGNKTTGYRPLAITVSDGVLERWKRAEGEIAVVNPADLRLSITSAIPATGLTVGKNDQGVGKAAGTKLGIRPMNVGSLTSTISVTVTAKGGGAVPLVFRAVTASPPEALWSPQPFDRNDLAPKRVGEAVTGAVGRPERGKSDAKPVTLSWAVSNHSARPPQYGYPSKRNSPLGTLKKPAVIAELAKAGFAFPAPDMLDPGTLLEALRGMPRGLPIGCILDPGSA